MRLSTDYADYTQIEDYFWDALDPQITQITQIRER